MIKWIKAFFAVDNTVNEHTVMGLLFFVASIFAGFIPAVGTVVFGGYLGACLTCFGLALKKVDLGGQDEVV